MKIENGVSICFQPSGESPCTRSYCIHIYSYTRALYYFMDCAAPTTTTISIGEMPRPSVLLYIIYAEQQLQLLLLQCSRSLSSPGNRLDDGLLFIYILILFFPLLPLPVYFGTNCRRTLASCVPKRNKLRSRDLQTSCVSMSVCEYLGSLIDIGSSAAKENASRRQ